MVHFSDGHYRYVVVTCLDTNARFLIASPSYLYSRWRLPGVVVIAGNRRNVLGGCVLGGSPPWREFVYKVALHTFASAPVLSVRRRTARADRLCQFLRSVTRCVVVALGVASDTMASFHQICRRSRQRLYCTECDVHGLRVSARAICA